jgi:hypothetical protein
MKEEEEGKIFPLLFLIAAGGKNDRENDESDEKPLPKERKSLLSSLFPAAFVLLHVGYNSLPSTTSSGFPGRALMSLLGPPSSESPLRGFRAFVAGIPARQASAGGGH